MDRHLQVFEEARSELRAIAYRMLGSVSEADDVLQEAYLRWRRVKAEQVAAPRAYLARVVTRLAIDALRSAKARRETYVGPWIPEPTAERPGEDLAESLSLAFLLVLEQLSPPERAAFLLREVFSYPYAEIAAILEQSEPAARQLVSRGRKRLSEGRPRFRPEADQHEALLGAFVAACGAGDIAGLLRLLSRDVVLWSDGGGQRHAARNLIRSADHVARFLLGVVPRQPEGQVASPCLVNGLPALALRVGDTLTGLISLDGVLDGAGAPRIAQIYTILNPDKLAAFERSAQGPAIS